MACGIYKKYIKEKNVSVRKKRKKKKIREKAFSDNKHQIFEFAE